MHGQSLLRTLPRKDVCIFCALRPGKTPTAILRPYGGQERPLHASRFSNRPSAAAHAVAEEESNETPQSRQQPSPSPKPAQTSWPAFVPKRPVANAVEPEDRPPEAIAQSSMWKCATCGNSNLARRTFCPVCREPKPASLEHPAEGAQQSRSGWGRFLTVEKPPDPTDREFRRSSTVSDPWRFGADARYRDPVRRVRGHDPSRSRFSRFGFSDSQDSQDRVPQYTRGRERLSFSDSQDSQDRVPQYTRGRERLSFSDSQDSQDRVPQYTRGRERLSFSNEGGQRLQGEISASNRDELLTPVQRSSRDREGQSDRTQDHDARKRSGLDALLEYAESAGRPKPQFAHTSGSGSTQRATRPSTKSDVPQYRGALRFTPNPSSPPESSDARPPSLGIGVQEGTSHQSRGGDQRADREEAPRARGRFHDELDEDQGGPQASPRRSGSPRWERKSARQMAPERSENAFQDLDEELSLERQKRKKKAKDKSVETTPTRTSIQLAEFISVENLATVLRVRLDEFVSRMVEMGFDRPRHDHILDAETSGLIASEFNFEPTFGAGTQVQDLVARPAPEDRSQLPPRPPIVTIMGHVDHGKTTILDWLRKSSVVASEHGGITQHIGAFSVAMPGGKQITFLDTPGHAAFLEMRRRGANVTDIVILVVAADDSVKPQTIEAIKHATDAKVPIIVAMNKVDKEDSNVNAVKQDLARHGVTVEDYGGDVQAIPVSGKFGRGMGELEEAAVALSEILDHRAEIDGPVEGWIIESKKTLAGRVATVLVRRGTLRAGDIIVAGTTWARLRTLRNDAGVIVDEAPPGIPVQIDGWRADDPIAGQEVLQADDEEHAKDVVGLRREREEVTRLAGDTAAINATRAEEAEARTQQLALEAEQQRASARRRRRRNDNVGWVERKSSSGPKQVHFVVKADVSGSVEAVVNSISAIGNNEIAANVIRTGVGGINESDIQHLASSGETGHLISFNQPVDASMSRLAEMAGLEILDHNIIYKLTDTVKEKLSAELPPLTTQRVVGEAEIGEVFQINAKRQIFKIAGCRIHNGVVARAKQTRVLRRGQVIYDGTLSSLKNVKKDVTEMRKGSECGMGFENWEDFEAGDQVQCYEEQQTARTL